MYAAYALRFTAQLSINTNEKTPYCLQAQLVSHMYAAYALRFTTQLSINTNEKTHYCLQAQLGKFVDASETRRVEYPDGSVHDANLSNTHRDRTKP